MSETRCFPDDCTPAEVASIRALARLAKKWPDSLRLFSQSGTLLIVENNGAERMTEISGCPSFEGIPNDGGDADWF